MNQPCTAAESRNTPTTAVPARTDDLDPGAIHQQGGIVEET